MPVMLVIKYLKYYKKKKNAQKSWPNVDADLHTTKIFLIVDHNDLLGGP